MIENTDRNALLAAATKAAKALGDLPPFDVLVDGQEAAVARLRLQDQAGELGPLFAYATKKAGVWQIHGFGTFFEQTFYAEHKVPAGLQL